MLYRRKVLLALIEVFGRSLLRTDCEKLLFLFCQRTDRNYYDFFPHMYGGFSILSYQDKKHLTDLGFLSKGDDFALEKQQSFLYQLQPDDQAALRSLATEVKHLRGRQLIRQIYLDYPYYAIRSKIASEVLNAEEYAQVCREWIIDQSPRLFTIGYEGISIDAYLNKLIAYNIKALVDVRKNPVSMKYGFSKTTLKDYVESAGIRYFHLPDLGIPSALRQNLDTLEAYKQLFQKYRTEILPNQIEAIERLKAICSSVVRIAITCFEADYHFCHRHSITEYLEEDPNFDKPITHLPTT